MQDLCFVNNEARNLFLDADRKHAAALTRLARSGFSVEHEVIYEQCLEVVAHENDYNSYSEFLEYQLLISAYFHRRSVQIWRPSAWREENYKSQIDSLIQSARTNTPLRVCAALNNTSFIGFNFSIIVYNTVFGELNKTHSISPDMVVFDFTRLDARGAFIDRIWSRHITSCKKANLSNAQFYDAFRDEDDRMVCPGAQFFEISFEGATLTGADLRSGYLRRCNFYLAELSGTDFRNSNTGECDFFGSKGFPLTQTPSEEEIDTWSLYLT